MVGTTASPYPTYETCPTQSDLVGAYQLLLPRGPAWGEGGPAREPGGVIFGFLEVLAAVFAQLHAAICAFYLEYSCFTATQTYAWWLAEYGLPDGCDPYPNLCQKVAAQGGVTCAFYEAIAASLGWSITCGENCSAGPGCLMAGQPGGPLYPPGTLMVFVDLEQSSAYSGGQNMGPVAGFLEAGMAIYCGPDISALDCVLQRIVHAEIQIVYFFS
jgi:hypothetical protein